MPSSLRMASPWTRDLLTGGAVRTCGRIVVGRIAPDSSGGWKVFARGWIGWEADREKAKRNADIQLDGDNWPDNERYVLVNIPGGTVVEGDMPAPKKKPVRREFREG